MMLMDFLHKFLQNIIKIDADTPSHISVSVLGIKCKILKPELKKERKSICKKYQEYADPADIPVAQKELRLIQLANKGFLKRFDWLCRENDIQYWIDFGTLLGAVRHKGFIPWDDDIDIAMPRDSYNKLIKMFQEKQGEYSDFQLLIENNGRNKAFVKIKHAGSQNLFIDVFPYDFYHSKVSDNEKKILSSKIAKLTSKKIFSLKRSEKSLRNRFKNETAKFLLQNKPVDLQKEPALFMGIDFPHKWANKVYDWDTIYPLGYVKFEDVEFPAPHDSGKVLESIYGDYMKIPKDSYPRHSNYAFISDAERNLLTTFAE